MDFFTPFYISCQRLRERWLRCCWVWLLCGCLGCGLMGRAPAAWAQSGGEVRQLQLESLDDGWYLSASLQINLPTGVEQALYKGLPLQFVMQAELLRPRWYWRDARVARATRYLRLSYQPLSRRWRVWQSNSPVAEGGTLGLNLAPQFDDLPEALASMQRVARWKLAEPEQVDASEPHVLRFELQLDASQLPRPLQLGSLGSAGWHVHLARSLQLPARED